MNNIKALALSSISIFLLFSCNRKENDSNAGKGGNAVLNCTPTHHESYTNIINGKIFIKYNAQNIPQSYDDSAICVIVNGKPTATFSNLKTGEYYISGTGYDNSISQNVKGGIPYKIVAENSINLEIPLTETH